MENIRYTPDYISVLGADEVFVFGSNAAGIHGGGAAHYAYRHFGAVWGVGEGLRGQSYAIPTMFGSVDEIKPYVDKFIEFARSRKDLTFLVTPIGCGIAGWQPADIAPLFQKSLGLANVILPRSFADIIADNCQLQPSWNAQSCINRLEHCRYAIENGDKLGYAFRKQIRKEVYVNTIEIVGKGRYIGGKEPDCEEVLLGDDTAMMADTVFVDTPFSVAAIPQRSLPTSFSVVNEDCLDVAARHVREGYLPAVHNFASNVYPGGGVITGSGAQEESIFRRSDAFRSLYQFVDFENIRSILAPSGQQDIVGRRPERYPLHQDFGGVYTPGVTVFRKNEKCGFELMSEPFKIGLITVAAINHPHLVDETTMDESCVITTLNKIRTVLRLALRGDHDSLVLGAFGCGAYDNPSAQMASLFRQVFGEDEFKDKFRLVTFAVLDDGRKSKRHPDGLFRAFADQFA